MKQSQKIAVIGGAGRTGQYLVKQLLEQGFQLRLLLRNPSSFSISNPFIEIIEGNVLDANIVDLLVQGCDAVISTVGQRNDEPLVASAGTSNILTSIENHEVSNGSIRYILLAGLNVDTPSDKKGPETQKATDWMKAAFPEIQKDRQNAYMVLENSPVSWTLVRVPFIEFNNQRSELKVSLEDCPGPKISVADIAGFLIRQLTDTAYVRKSPFISN